MLQYKSSTGLLYRNYTVLMKEKKSTINVNEKIYFH